VKAVPLARVLALWPTLASGVSALAQYTDPVVIRNLGGAEEFSRRRQELAKQPKTGYLILFARIVLPEANHYREDNHFFYFTGLSDQSRPGGDGGADRRIS